MKRTRYFIIGLIAVLQTIGANAQVEINYEDNEKLDSLQSILLTDAAPAVKVEVYNLIGYDLMFTDSTTSFQYLDSALSLANKIKDPVSIIEAKINRADVLMEYGAYEKGKELFTEVLEMLELNNLTENKVHALVGLALVAEHYGDYKVALGYYNDSEAFARAMNDSQNLADVLHYVTFLHQELGNTEKALSALQESYDLSRALNDEEGIAACLLNMGMYYGDLKEYDKAIASYEEALDRAKKVKQVFIEAAALNNIAGTYYSQKRYTESLEYFTALLKMDQASKHRGGEAMSLLSIGKVYFKLEDYGKSLSNYLAAYQIALQLNDLELIADAALGIGETYQELGDSRALQYLMESYNVSNDAGNLELVLSNSKSISDFHELKGNYKKSLEFLKIYNHASDSLRNEEKTKAITRLNADMEFQSERDSLELVQATQKLSYESTLKRRRDLQIVTTVFLLGVIISLMVIYSFNKAKQKALVESQGLQNELNEQLEELKTTQDQLVQSEKMASLGELTAGIAHEIQNPLNFVNNFSEVSEELIDEMHEELKKGDLEEVKAISNDLKNNLAKINHHGKRAGDIVKGMLQHSRVGSGKREPTDVNVLCDEYLRLAYHGLRAKDKLFKATMKTEFDESIEKINIVPQDIGRVILNLITNAFYVVNQKRMNSDDSYEPTVSVSTKKEDHSLYISVTDNGSGIPDDIKEKIFQPFFTTKPTGSGTGLGLSLSYDIVKAHGGELKVETKEGEGSEFTIILKNE